MEEYFVMRLDMSEKELDRVTVLSQLNTKLITHKKASELLKLSVRQTQRLSNKLKSEGPHALISSKRGVPSNRCISSDIRTEAFRLIDLHYYDYGPTLISEKLSERHNINVSKETIRQWLISSGRRKSKEVKKKVVRQLRARRPCFGELIQIDGSIHDWFEGRGETCTLLVFIDDSTSRVVNLLMVPSETTLGYFAAIKEYLLSYGKPRAIYTDKHVVFKVNTPGGKQTNGLTQFGRALKELDIEAIFAHSPEAKGRVERANNTLQDRLVKDFRFYNISNITDANRYLKDYMKFYNDKFSVEPMSNIDLHRPLTKRETLLINKTLSITKTRRVTRHLIIKHNNVSLQLTNVGKGHKYKGKKVTIHENFDGTMSIYYQNKQLEFSIYGQAAYKPRFANRKDIDKELQMKQNIFLMHKKINDRGENV